MNSEKATDTAVPSGEPAAVDEEALFQRLYARVSSALAAGGKAIETGAEAVSSAASDAAQFARNHTGVAAALAIPALGVAASALLAASLVSRQWASGTQEERVGYMLRVPASLREAIAAIAAKQNRSVNELLTEAALDVLAKYGEPYIPASTEAAPPSP
jgi:hypothetical protein